MAGRDHELFCLALKSRRRELGMSQAEVAKRLGISQPCYSEIETGAVCPTLATASRFAAAVDSTLLRLLSPQPEPSIL